VKSFAGQPEICRASPRVTTPQRLGPDTWKFDVRPASELRPAAQQLVRDRASEEPALFTVLVTPGRLF